MRHFVLIILFCVVYSSIASDTTCFPPCRAGYLCHEGECVEKCNPPCPEGKVCTDDGKCVPDRGKEVHKKPSKERSGAEKSDVPEGVSEKIRFWINSGFGPSTIEFANGGTITVEYKRLLLSFFMDYNWVYDMFPDKEPAEEANGIGINAGTAFYRKFGTISIAAGPAFVWGMKRGEFLYTETGWFAHDVYAEDEFYTVGLSVYTHLIFTPLPFLGLGIQAWGNLNTELSYAGFMGCLYVGKLRK